MQVVMKLREMAAAARAGAQSKLEEARAQCTEATTAASEWIKSTAAPLIESGVARGRAAAEAVRSARASAVSRVQEVVSETVARAQFWRKLAGSTYEDVKVRGLRVHTQEAVGLARQVVFESAASAKCKAHEAVATTKEVVSTPAFKTSAVAAAAGGSTLGAAGATAGVVVGGVAGGLAGLPLALFTFGLSIPVGAVVGSSAVGALGLASGTAVGAVSGGALGYAGFKKQDEIREVGASAMGKVSDSTQYVKGRALASAEYARDAVKATKERLRRAGTGGTAEATD
jgi:hypothetical protein